MLIWVIFAHYIADWALQTDFMAQKKGRYWIVMMSHCFVWAGCISFVLQWLGLFNYDKFFFLFFGHWAMDKLKMDKTKYLPTLNDADYKRIETDKDANDLIKKVEAHNLKWLYIDQLFHLGQCIIIFFFKD